MKCLLLRHEEIFIFVRNLLQCWICLWDYSTDSSVLEAVEKLTLLAVTWQRSPCDYFIVHIVQNLKCFRCLTYLKNWLHFVQRWRCPLCIWYMKMPTVCIKRCQRLMDVFHTWVPINLTLFFTYLAKTIVLPIKKL